MGKGLQDDGLEKTESRPSKETYVRGTGSLGLTPAPAESMSGHSLHPRCLMVPTHCTGLTKAWSQLAFSQQNLCTFLSVSRVRPPLLQVLLCVRPGLGPNRGELDSWAPHVEL